MEIIINDKSHKYFLYNGILIKKETNESLVKINNEEFKISNKSYIIIKEHEKEIPKGSYCYSILSAEGFNIKTKPCKYWKQDTTKQPQNNGFCSLLNVSDWEHDELLWDQCKSCGINED